MDSQSLWSLVACDTGLYGRSVPQQQAGKPVSFDIIDPFLVDNWCSPQCSALNHTSYPSTNPMFAFAFRRFASSPPPLLPSSLLLAGLTFPAGRLSSSRLCCSVRQQRTTNNERRTTNNEQRTTNDERRQVVSDPAIHPCFT